MNARTACASGLSLLLLAACQSTPPAPPSHADVAPQAYQTLRTVKILTKTPTPTRDEDCDTRPDAGDVTKRCVVKVKATWDAGTATCTVTEAPNVNLKGDKGAIVIWDLPRDFFFCPALGDGVFLIEPDDVADDSFDDFGAPSEGAGNNVFRKCRNRYRIFAENNVAAHKDKPYAYAMQFHYRSATSPKDKFEKNACIADPFIKNGR